MAEKKKGEKVEAKAPSKRHLYKVEGGKIVRLRRSCPKCGAGVFLAEHKDRAACGHCGYLERKAAAPTPPG